MTAFSSEARKGCRQPERASLFVLHFLISRNFVMCRLNFCAEFATYFSLGSSAASASASSCFFVQRAQKFCGAFLARFLCKLRVLKKPVQKFQMNINHAHSWLSRSTDKSSQRTRHRQAHYVFPVGIYIHCPLNRCKFMLPQHSINQSSLTLKLRILLPVKLARRDSG